MNQEIEPAYSETGMKIGNRIIKKMFTLNNVDYFIFSEGEIFGQVFPIQIKIDQFSFIEKNKISKQLDFSIKCDGEKFSMEIYNYHEYYTGLVNQSLNWLEDPRLKRCIHYQKIWMHICHFPMLMSNMFESLCKTFKLDPTTTEEQIVDLGLNIKPNFVYVINIATDDFVNKNYNAILDRIEYGNGEGSKHVDFNMYFRE